MDNSALNAKFRDLEHRADKSEQDKQACRKFITDELGRMKRVLLSMHNPEERWNFICDNTSDTRSGLWLCEKLIAWAKTTRVGVKRPVVTTSEV